MGIPTPTIPSFTDGMLVHAVDLNALAANLTNLYNYNNAGFTTQKPCVIATQTSSQPIANTTDVLVSFQTAAVNTDNMWTASAPTQLTIQHAGIYLIVGSVHYPILGGATTSTVGTANIWINGTSPTNAVIGANQPAVTAGAGIVPTCVTLQNLAAGATVYLDAFHTFGSTQNLVVGYGSYLAAMFLTPST